MYAQENFTMEQPEVPPLPAGWSTVDKKAYLISSDVFNIICGVFTVFYAFCFVTTGGLSQLSSFGQESWRDTLGKYTGKYTGYTKTMETYNKAEGYSKLVFVIIFLLGLVAVIMGIIRMIYDANTEWQVLDYNVPELEGDVNVPISEDTA